MQLSKLEWTLRWPQQPTVDADTGEFDKSKLEHFTKGLAAYALGCYAFGVLAVNQYLYRLGIYDYSAVEPRFFYTGFLCFSPPVLFAICWFGIYQRDLLSQHGIGKVSGLLPLKLLSTIAVLIVLYFPATKLFGSGQWLTAYFYLLFFGLVCGLVLASGIAMNFRINTPSLNLISLALHTIVFAFCSFQYVQAFADHYYPYVPVQFGGGKGYSIDLVLNDTTFAQFRKLGLQESRPGMLRAYVINEGAESLDVCVPLAKVTTRQYDVVRIPKTAVSASVVVLGNEAQPCFQRK